MVVSTDGYQRRGLIAFVLFIAAMMGIFLPISDEHSYLKVLWIFILGMAGTAYLARYLYALLSLANKK